MPRETLSHDACDLCIKAAYDQDDEQVQLEIVQRPDSL